MRFLWSILVLGFLLAPQAAGAQSDPVVFAVLFYSPTCPHCHQVIQNDLPPLQEEYGVQLQILFVNVTMQAGRDLFGAACESLNVPDERCGSVPMMIVGSTVLVGSYEIPNQLPELIDKGLASGGIGLPAIPGLQEAYNAAVQSQEATSESETEAAPEPSEESIIQTEVAESSWKERFQDDPVANGIAVAVLVFLILGTAALLVNFYTVVIENRVQAWLLNRPGWLVTLLVAVVTTIIAATLVLEQDDFSIPTLLAMAITGALMIIAGTIWSSRSKGLPSRVLPAVAVVGLLVAGYMVYVEVGENDAVCGAVGDCNTVQQSDYATLLGLIPIGVLGIIGYLTILGTWYLGQQPSESLALWGQLATFGLTLFGAIFSIYLTFLEPFVIGATCAWCLTSAMLMLLLLWLQAPTGLKAIRTLADQH